MTILRIRFPKNFGKEVRQAMFKSKRVKNTFEVHNSVLYINSEDFEETEKIFNRIVLNFKLL